MKILITIGIVVLAGVVVYYGFRSRRMDDEAGRKEKAEEKPSGCASSLDGLKTEETRQQIVLPEDETIPYRENMAKLKEELYHFLNHGLRMMYRAYGENDWGSLEEIGDISEELYRKMQEIVKNLPEYAGSLVNELFSCMDFKDGSAGKTAVLKEKEKGRKAYLSFMMPFYLSYYPVFYEGGIRYSALLSPETLKLFSGLSGKKFRPGYRNRYRTGVRAFEWEKNRYKVFDKDGLMLCDAVFEDGKPVHGFGQIRKEDPKSPDWEIVQSGMWKDGIYESSTVRYEYKKAVK